MEQGQSHFLTQIALAARSFSREGIERISTTVISVLRESEPVGMFEDVAASNRWDEFCWAVNVGEDSNFGLVGDMWRETVTSMVSADLQSRLQSERILLGIGAIEETSHQVDGQIAMDAIPEMVLDKILHQAELRNLEMIGPDRAYAVVNELNISDLPWMGWANSEELSELVMEHVDALVVPRADLSVLAAGLAEICVEDALTAGDWTLAGELVENFKDEIVDLMIEKSILPALERVRNGFLQKLDG